MREITGVWQRQQVKPQGKDLQALFALWHREKNAAEKTSGRFFLNEDIWKMCMERAGVCCVFEHPFLDLVLDLICFPVM